MNAPRFSARDLGIVGSIALVCIVLGALVAGVVGAVVGAVIGAATAQVVLTMNARMAEQRADRAGELERVRSRLETVRREERGLPVPSVAAVPAPEEMAPPQLYPSVVGHKPNPESIYLARRAATLSRLGSAGMPTDVAEARLASWEARAAAEGLERGLPAWWDRIRELSTL